MAEISVIIHTYQSEKHLRACLEAVQGFDEVVICDMYSTDKTLEIAAEFGARVIFHEHTGVVEPARNFAISHATHEWVLVVDSDEVVPDALRNYCYDFVGSAKGERYAGLYIPRKNYFMGRMMHGAYPDYILRLFKRSKTHWPPVIHSLPQVAGELTHIPRSREELAFIHLADERVEQHLTKMNLYTEKERVRRKGQSPSISKAFFSAAFRFVKGYFFKGGFRDGKAGYVNAMFSATYKFFSIAKLWEDELR